jgi:hypothetical protein
MGKDLISGMLKLLGMERKTEKIVRPGELVDGGGVEVVTHLFFQCIVAWRSLPQVRGSECQSFSSSLCFTSAKCVSRVSARSLIHVAHAVCICVPVTVLNLQILIKVPY